MSRLRNISWALAVTGSLLALSGCDEVSGKVENAFYKGTHKAVQLCVNRNKGEVLSPEALRAACVQKHETEMSYAPLSGTAILVIGPSTSRINGDVKNNSSGSVVTAFTVTAQIYDASGEKVESNVYVDNIWLEPGKSHSFAQSIDNRHFYRKELFPWCNQVPQKNGKYMNCKDWVISKARGVSILVN